MPLGTNKLPDNAGPGLDKVYLEYKAFFQEGMEIDVFMQFSI